MSNPMARLGRNAQRGSKPRCHWLTHGSAEEIAARLTAMAAPWATVSATDSWMPEGFEVTDEAQLHQAPRLLDPLVSRVLADWWLPSDRESARTPNFDVASTCTIEGKRGLLLVEAKAHAEELRKEEAGRSLGDDATDDRRASHETIGKALREACAGLTSATSRSWAVSRDNRYQMSNRFAWSWKLAEQGVPVVLIYLGFLNANEMADKGEPFTTETAWDRLVRDHSASLFPDAVWNHRWAIDGVPFIPLIRTIEQRLEHG